MRKKISITRPISLICAALLILSLVSCGEQDNAADSGGDVGYVTSTAAELNIAFVRDGDAYAYASENESASAALAAFAKDRGSVFSEFTADTPSEESRLDSINTAVALGANVVVCVGRYMQKAVTEAQYKYPETSFLIVCGEEPDGQTGDVLSENTHCILFREEDAGYVAGYIAIFEGSRTPAFFAFSEVPLAVRCFGGFVAGVSDAAKEIGADGVKVVCSMNNDSMLFDGIDGDIVLSAHDPEELFEHGADLIAAMGAQVNISAEPSYLNGTDLLPVCFEADDVYGIFTEYPRYDCGPVAVKALDRLASNGGKWSVRDAGSFGREGLAEGGITLAVPAGKDCAFGLAELEKLTNDAAKGVIRIPLYENAEDIVQNDVPIIYIGE